MVSSGKPSFQLSPVAGVKRPAPGPLLPAFEPTSSPQLPRPIKRINRVLGAERDATTRKYPTPLPTSSTGVLSSSPPPLPGRRPGLQRTQSNVSERAPLSAVPSITLSQDGEPVLMGRSSNSSHYQLSANRLISRVHVRAAYVPPASSEAAAKIQVTCLGWNGVKVHCQGRTWDLGKGDSFTSETEHAIMLDVQHARVLLAWPYRQRSNSFSSQSNSTADEGRSPWNGSTSPSGPLVSPTPGARGQPPESPVSPSPAGPVNDPSSSTLLPSDVTSGHNVVSVYEDDPSPDDHPEDPSQGAATQSTQAASQTLSGFGAESQLSKADEPEHFSDQDEENDPIIQSFGPQGDNILPRMASVTTVDSPVRRLRRRPLRAAAAASSSSRPSSTSTEKDDSKSLIANHVINQLAFSRLSSTPLSTIWQSLPAELTSGRRSGVERRAFTKNELVLMLDGLAAIGSVQREGKDAAGKPLETEYYYVPDLDTDEGRREAVVNGLRKPGLRACRKQHKQYFWRKPKTP